VALIAEIPLNDDLVQQSEALIAEIPLNDNLVQQSEALIAEIPLNDDLVQQSDNSLSLSQADSYYFQGKYQEAIAIWLGLLEKSIEIKDQAKIQGYLGAAYKQSGQVEEAVIHWQTAVAIYRDLNEVQQLALILVDLAQAYNSLGQPQKAIALLTEAISLSTARNDLAIQAVAINALATSYLVEGNYEQAIENYQKSLGLGQLEETMILNNLTKAYNLRSLAKQKLAFLAETEADKETLALNSQEAQQDEQLALNTAKRAVATSKQNNLAAVGAMLNQMKLTKTNDYVDRVKLLLQNLPPSRDKAYALISLAQLLPSNQATEELLSAISISQQINDQRTLSEALGNLGKLYETTQPTTALKYTQQAQNTAQQVQAFDLLYRWLWQAGRIYRLSGQTTEAITAYKQAIGSLQTIRQSVFSASSDLRLDFQSQIQPVYRELIEILLTSASSSDLKEALSIFELFQISELQDFFGDDCVIASPIQSSQEVLANTNTAVVYSIILNDLTYLILQLPSGRTFKYTVQIARENIEQQIKLWRQELEDIASNHYVDLSKSLYSLLFRPLESDLKTEEPTTILFINDGILRNVPMAALHDGSEFLIQKYAIVNSLGLNFSLKSVASSSNLNPLIFGITEAVPPFNPGSSVPFMQINN